MTPVIVATIIVLAAFLVIIIAMRPISSVFSQFEIERRIKNGDIKFKKDLNRIKLREAIYNFRSITLLLIIPGIFSVSVSALGWTWGPLLTALIIIFSVSMSRISFVNKFANKFYAKYEKTIIKFVSKNKFVSWLLNANKDIKIDRPIASIDELKHIIESSSGVLGENEKKLIVNGLSFHSQLVSKIMVPKQDIISVNKTEFLGPLALDDLHKTGHGRLPVIGDDINHIVGILYIRGLLALDIKRSTTAEKAMETKVYYIRDDRTLSHALATFLKTHYDMLIVINKDRETVGLLTIEDVIQALIGRKPVVAFEEHDNIHAVAKHKEL